MRGVAAMFVVYLLVIFAGLVLYSIIGATNH
jgi:hypothetical protein